MAPEDHYDVIVIGSGQAALPLINALGEAGRKTALVERKHQGGSCINFGCTPTKTMIASARVAYLANRAGDYGVETGPVSVDMKKVRQRKRDIVDEFRGGLEKNAAAAKGAAAIMGEATFVGPKEIEVKLNSGGAKRLTADTIVIDVGTRTQTPDLAGLDTVPWHSSTTIMDLDQLPEHLIILGGGYIGLEFGQMFRRFGSKVTIVQRGKQLMGREDQDVADAVADIMREDGIEVLLETQAVRVANKDGAVELTVSSKGKEQTISGSHLLVAIGRTPNTNFLNTEAAGIKLDERGFIPVNDKLETNVPGVYAVGDVNGGPAFTHISYDDYRILSENLIKNGNATMKGRLVPYVVYIDPQLGRVGLTEQQAREQKLDIKVAKMPMLWVARAIETAETRGFMKAIVDAKTEQILGYAVLGVEGGELMSMIEIAMLGKLPYTVLQNAILAHPTLAESLNNLFGNFED